MPEMNDFPSTHRINILEVGSIAGEEDILARKTYSCSFICYSAKGTVYQMSRDDFLELKRTDHAWIPVQEQIVRKEFRAEALDIEKVKKVKKLTATDINSM